MARGGLTALGTRGRGPRSGRAWSAQRHLETRRDVVNKTQLHPVDTFAERHPANQPTATSLKHSLRHSHNQPKTSTTRFRPEKGGVLRTSKSKCQFIRKKAGFHGQTPPHKAIIIRNNRATVARWLGADLPPSVLEGGAR